MEARAHRSQGAMLNSHRHLERPDVKRAAVDALDEPVVAGKGQQVGNKKD